MTRLLAAFVCLCSIFCATARAENVVLGLSQDEVSITATFDGSDILIFGAVKREEPIPTGAPLEVIVTVSGPSRPVSVRRKERLGPIWVNRSALALSSAPSFYAVASSAPLSDILSPDVDAQLAITVPHHLRSDAALDPDFVAALIRLRSAKAMYQNLENAVSISEQTLFRTQIALPSDLTEGYFRARIILLRDGVPVDIANALIPVHKVGLERLLYTSSRSHPLLYGLASLVIACFAGWAAAAVFRLIKS